MIRSVAAAAIFLIATGVVTEASAADEVTTLETQLGKDTSELSTSDCAAACKALASIRRAADRICELEPGPRCDAARTKADNATKKVRDACPECAIAGLKKDDDEKRAAKPAEAPPPAPMNATSEGAPAEPRGGCRNCSTSSGAPDRGDFAVFALAALVLLRRARKTKTRL